MHELVQIELRTTEPCGCLQYSHAAALSVAEAPPVMRARSAQKSLHFEYTYGMCARTATHLKDREDEALPLKR